MSVSTATPSLLPLEQVAGLPLGHAARVYAEAGVPIFPCIGGTKRPGTENAFADATTDLDQIDWWWSRHPHSNIGLRTGHGVDVLDIDVHSAGDGFGPLRQLLQIGLGNTWSHAVRSPSGGLHLYYPSDPDRPQRTWSRRSAHLDFRGTGGYIMAPPSQIRVGGHTRTYQPVGPTYPGRPVDAERIRDLLAPPTPTRPPGPVFTGAMEEDGQRIADWLARQEGSNTNELLFWSACRLVEHGATESETVTALIGAASQLGLGDREIHDTITRAHQHTAPDPDLTGSRTSVRHASLRGLG
ncbi:bifunctional DNA primase/polymerase [Kocuria carniphila]|uniref:Bifunctional DNA primase/polymerase n=1 Tax=Kocuria carniphila TaxID=262208 RepID=A0ABV3V551_9MICC